MKNIFNFALLLSLILAVSLACSSSGAMETTHKTEKLQSYVTRGVKFSYYKIPANLKREDLIKTARELHRAEPDANLILVDDDSKVGEYVNYAQAFSKNNFEVELPKDWADKHVVANVQRLISGKWQLYEGYGYREIADLE